MALPVNEISSYGNLPQSVSFWDTVLDEVLQIQASIDGLQYYTVTVGKVDRVDFDLGKRRILLCGRDLSCRFVDSLVQETFINRTASEITTILAERRGLEPVVVPTTALAGRYYHDQYDTLILGQSGQIVSEWDLLVTLARQEGFDLYVAGTELHFGPSTSEAAPSLIVSPSTATSIRVKKSLVHAADIGVSVLSWNSRLQAAFAETVVASRAEGATSASMRQYRYFRPNLTPEQASALAGERISEIIQNEYMLEVEMPGELQASARDTLYLIDTGTSLDRVYQVQSITRRLSAQGGFEQRLRASCSSPRVTSSISSSPLVSA